MGSDTPFTIGFTRNFSTGVPFWTIAEYGMREQARIAGVQMVVYHSSTADEQSVAIQRFIQQQVDVIIVAPIDPEAPVFQAAINQTNMAGIPVVAVDTAFGGQVRCLIRSDDLRGGITGATYLAERLQGRGKVVHLRGAMQTSAAQLRSAGVHQVLDRFSEITMIEAAGEDWQRPYGRAVMREILAVHPDVRGVITANDPLALGALDSLAETGSPDRAVVIGLDGDPDALLALADGVLAATVARSPYQLGRMVISTTVDILQGIDVPPEVIIDDMILLTPATVTHAALESLRLMPGLIDSLMTSNASISSERAVLRTIIDSLPDPIYVKDHEGRFEVANQATAQIMGADTPDSLIGKTDFDFHSRDLAVQYAADEQAILQSGVPLLKKEETVIDSDGVQHWLLTTKVLTQDYLRGVTRLVGHSQDITALKQAANERERLQEELIRVQASALEELSTPLMPISDTMLVMPLIGTIDSRRAGQILEALLEGVAQHQAELVIIDITGVNVVDTQVANAIIQAARAVRLIGAQVVLTGLRPEVAQALVSLGVDLKDIVTHSTLQRGVAYGLRVSAAQRKA